VLAEPARQVGGAELDDGLHTRMPTSTNSMVVRPA
jgi:hypothetical protein